MTATYIKHGRGKSINAIDAEASGRMTGSAWAKKIGQGVTAADIAEAMPYGEWHHTGKFANRTRYYDYDSITEHLPDIILARDRRLEGKSQIGRYKIMWQTWRETRGNYGRKSWAVDSHEFIGDAEIKGDWVHFDGRKMLMTGRNFISCDEGQPGAPGLDAAESSASD